MKKLDFNKNPAIFSISWRTYNRQNKLGGKLISERNVKLMQAPKHKGKVRLSQSTEFKNPNHYENRTRNFKLSSGKTKKIHVFFITEFNGMQVVL